MADDIFRFDSVIPLFYKLKQVNLNCDESYPYSREWLKNKNFTKNPQYAVMVGLNQKKKKRYAKNIID